MSTLYPPLIDTFMPAFLREGPGVAVFSVSPYNSDSEIKRVHVSLVDQATNTNAIAANNSAAGNSQGTIVEGVWIVELSSLYKNPITNLYTLEIPTSILKGTDKTFNITNYYKLQLRFDSCPNSIESEYLIKKRQYFSEWSSVCLLKAIPDFEIVLDTFDDNTSEENPTFNAGIIPISGRVQFNNNLIGKNAETLRSYKIDIFEESDLETVIVTSGTVFTGDSIDPNQIYWLADMENAIVGGQYRVVVSVITKNQYATSKNYNFEIYDFDTTPFEVKWKFKKIELEKYNITNNGKIVTEEDGIVRFNISTTTSMPPGYLYVKRASSLDDYQKWDLISCTKENGAIDRDFEDMTVGSLVRYKYSAQYQLKKGTWTRSRKSDDLIYPDFYDILLSRDGRQLAIRYDAKITTMKPVVNRQKIDTLGGKYPKFAENANMNYKQFNISGYIDAESDYNRRFLNEKLYQNQMDDYDDQMEGKYEVRNDTLPDGEYNYPNSHKREQKNTVHDIYPKDNWWWEREFREQAIQWLNDGEPKLFRSMTEGNMAVMLTDISLSPNQTIGRRLYSFTATMYEIENGYNLQTLNSLGIIDIPNDKEIKDIHDGGQGGGGGEDEDEDTDLITVTTVGQMYSQYMEPTVDTRGIGGEATVINGIMGADEDGNHPCGISGFDYKHTSLEDWYNYIAYEANSVDGKKYKVQDGSIQLKNLTIQFESLPTWWTFTASGEILPVEDNTIALNESVFNSNTIALGYKIKINDQNIFVNEKGYYQVPSNLVVKDLFIYRGAIATLGYIITYKLEYNDTTIPSQTKLAAKIVSQLSGMWMPGVRVSSLIERKHKWTKYADGQVKTSEFLNTWNALGLEVTPYAIAAIQYADEDKFSPYVVGRTGIYNWVDDYEIKEMYFMGRRMTRADGHKTPYLDEWEFVLDKSAINNKANFKEWNLTWVDFINDKIKQIKETETLVDINNVVSVMDDQGINRLWNNDTNSTIPALGGYEELVPHPEYNTVYGFKNKDGSITYKIFYIDNYWYNVTFYDEEQTILLAEVPIHGMINYRGDLIRQTF